MTCHACPAIERFFKDSFEYLVMTTDVLNVKLTHSLKVNQVVHNPPFETFQICTISFAESFVKNRSRIAS